MFSCAYLFLKGSFPRRRSRGAWSCAGLRLSKNLLPSLLSSVPLVPWGKRVQKYYLFSNWQALFSNIFHLFYILLTTREKKVHLLWVFPSFGSVFRGKTGLKAVFHGLFSVQQRYFYAKSGEKVGAMRVNGRRIPYYI